MSDDEGFLDGSGIDEDAVNALPQQVQRVLSRREVNGRVSSNNFIFVQVGNKIN